MKPQDRSNRVSYWRAFGYGYGSAVAAGIGVGVGLAIQGSRWLALLPEGVVLCWGLGFLLTSLFSTMEKGML